MTVSPVAVAPLFLNDVIMQIGATNSFETAISSATFTPSTKLVTFQGGTPASIFNFPAPTTWTLDLEYAQDWDTTDSLANYLHANEGTVVPAVFTPKEGDEDSPTVTANIIIAPGSIGGDIGSVGTSKVSLGVNGRPTVVPAT